jgi:N,N'-diacetyllegionaminate synthase
MLFVAEIGLNHNGNFHLAYELIRQAKQAGADIAKFQFGWRDKPDEINHIDDVRAAELQRWCDYWEVEMMASLITEEALLMARRLGLRRYKVASRTVCDNPALCERILSDGRETFVSLGMWDKPVLPFGPPTQTLRYIFCRSKYPTYPEDLLDLPSTFSESGYYGYSDHLHGIEGCIVALARGAQYIEKHLTMSRAASGIRDHVLSATPDEFAELTRTGGAVARLARALGPGAGR